MTRLFRCDQCGYQQETALPFALTQRLDEEDDDGEQSTLTLDLCGAQCLSDWAMGQSLDFPDEGDN